MHELRVLEIDTIRRVGDLERCNDERHGDQDRIGKRIVLCPRGDADGDETGDKRHGEPEQR